MQSFAGYGIPKMEYGPLLSRECFTMFRAPMSLREELAEPHLIYGEQIRSDQAEERSLSDELRSLPSVYEGAGSTEDGDGDG
jgi:hypothetical protein